MSIIVTKGSLDWAYPPFILSTTAAAMGLDVTMFFTFYGLPLLMKDLKLQVSSLGNPAMKMPMMGGHMGMPNIVSAIPGVDAAASKMMKNLIKKKGVASIEELREAAMKHGLIVYPGGISVDGAAVPHIMLAPPMLVEETHMLECMDCIDQAMGAVLHV